MARSGLRRRGALAASAAVLGACAVVGLALAGPALESATVGGAGTAASAPFPVTGPAPAGGPDGSFGAGADGAAPEVELGDSATDRAPATAVAPGATKAAPGSGPVVPPEPVPPGGPAAPDVVGTDRAVVRSARLSVTVTDLPAVSATVRDIAASVGGFVPSEHTVDRAASLTLRVPADRLDEVMARLAATGTVTERSGHAEDVTAQVVDLQGRLDTQRASVVRVRALLERATTVGEVVAVESELAAREAELESLQRRLASVSGRVAMSTLTVSLVPAPAVAPEQAGGGFMAGLAAGRRAFLAVAGGVLTALGAVLPFAVTLAVLLGLVLLGRRALRRHRAAAGAAPAAAADGGARD